MVWSLIKKWKLIHCYQSYLSYYHTISRFFWYITFFIFFLSGFCFMNIHDSQDSRGRGGNLFNSSLPLPPASQTLRHELCKLYFLHKRMPPCRRAQRDIFAELYLVAVVIKHKMDWKWEMLLYGHFSGTINKSHIG